MKRNPNVVNGIGFGINAVGAIAVLSSFEVVGSCLIVAGLGIQYVAIRPLLKAWKTDSRETE